MQVPCQSDTPAKRLIYREYARALGARCAERQNFGARVGWKK
jgi:hypothetical protein